MQYRIGMVIYNWLSYLSISMFLAMTRLKKSATDSSLSRLHSALMSLTATHVVSKCDCDKMGGAGGASGGLRLAGGGSAAQALQARDSPRLLYFEGKLAGTSSILAATLKAMRPDSKSMVEKYGFLLNSSFEISS